MTNRHPQRRWGSDRQLTDLLESLPGGMDIAVRDFALVTLAAQLSRSFPGQLVFKGGFVLRHVHGIIRFSRDVDATRTDPARHKLDSDEMAEAIRQAGIQNIIRFIPQEPATDSARSLDFDDVAVRGESIPDASVQVEISYREEVLDPPEPAHVGAPFYEDFEVLTMTVPEMASEKLRTLAQRIRPTDLADQAVLLQRTPERDDGHIAELAVVKFEQVKAGRANRIDRILEHLADMAETYDIVVPGLFPEAPPYREAMDIVSPRLRNLVP